MADALCVANVESVTTWLRGQDAGPETTRISPRLINLWCCVLGIGRDSWSNRGVIHGRLLGESGRGPVGSVVGVGVGSVVGVGVGSDEDVMAGAPYDVDRAIPSEIPRAAP
jgi:hypothetical protein